jgi:hypothetical protein
MRGHDGRWWCGLRRRILVATCVVEEAACRRRAPLGCGTEVLSLFQGVRVYKLFGDDGVMPPESSRRGLGRFVAVLADVEAAVISPRETACVSCDFGAAASRQPRVPLNIRLTRIKRTPCSPHAAVLCRADLWISITLTFPESTWVESPEESASCAERNFVCAHIKIANCRGGDAGPLGEGPIQYCRT